MRSNLFTRSRFIFPVNKGVKKQNLGEKSSGLVDLMRFGLNVPKTYACSWSAYQQYANGDDSVFEKILSELNEILTRKKKYAVRSSSNSEDTDLYSFAGQFESVLNVESPEKAVTAIRSIWDQIRSDELQFYLKEHHLTADGVLMGVIIQEMVDPELSGVLLTRNPVTYAARSSSKQLKDWGMY